MYHSIMGPEGKMKYQDKKRRESIMMSRLLVSNGKEGKRQKLGWMPWRG
jgi:hypothetical protein